MRIEEEPRMMRPIPTVKERRALDKERHRLSDLDKKDGGSRLLKWTEKMMAETPVTAWSYSRYADYEQCPARFKYKHIDQLPEPTGSPAMERGTLIHKLAEDYATGVLKKLPPELKHFGDQFKQLRSLNILVEQNWGFKSDWSFTGRADWFGPDVWLRVKADVAILYDDDTAEVIDHKTGRKYETNKDQVELFALATKMRFPNITHVTTRLWYLDQPKDNEVILEYEEADFARIQKTWTKRVVPMFKDRKFAPTPNDKCKWCAFSKRAGGPCKF